jgi:hypothetical protein
MKNVTVMRRYFRSKCRASYYIGLSVTQCQRLNRLSDINIWYRNSLQKVVEQAWSFVEISSVTFILFLGHKWFSARTSRISWPIWMKLCIVNFHGVSFRVCRLCKNRSSESRTLLKGGVKLCSYCLNSLWLLKKNVSYMRCPQQFVEWLRVTRQSAHWEPYFIYGSKWISVRTFYIYCSIWVKFVVTNLHVMRLSIFECRENRRRESYTFRVGVNETIVIRLP